MEKTLSSQLIYEGRVVKLRVDTVKMPNGRETTREIAFALAIGNLISYLLEPPQVNRTKLHQDGSGRHPLHLESIYRYDPLLHSISDHSRS